MQLPVLFKHEFESGIVARTKEYEIKAYHLLVDVEDDVKAFIDHGWQFVTEGERAIEHFAELTGVKQSDKLADAKVDAPKSDAPSDPAPAADASDKPAKAETKAAASKGKSAAK